MPSGGAGLRVGWTIILHPTPFGRLLLGLLLGLLVRFLGVVRVISLGHFRLRELDAQEGLFLLEGGKFELPRVTNALQPHDEVPQGQMTVHAAA